MASSPLGTGQLEQMVYFYFFLFYHIISKTQYIWLDEIRGKHVFFIIILFSAHPILPSYCIFSQMSFD